MVKTVLLVMSMFSQIGFAQEEVQRVSNGYRPTLTEIARDQYGDVLRLNHYEADAYCKSLGLRLPSICELALWMSQNGGAKFSNTWGATKCQESSFSDFFYSHYEYQAPAGAGDYFYWSSSMMKGDHWAFGIDTINGAIDWSARNSENIGDMTGVSATRCVKP